MRPSGRHRNKKKTIPRQQHLLSDSGLEIECRPHLRVSDNDEKAMRRPILQLIQHAPATRPITPSSASISRTKIPFPTPPMDGLQESSPILSIFCVRSKVRAPVRAAPVAASQPAWPPPMTQTKIGIKHDCEEFTERCVGGFNEPS